MAPPSISTPTSQMEKPRPGEEQTNGSHSHQASQKLSWSLAHWLPSPCILPASLSIPRHHVTGKEVSAGSAHHTQPSCSQPNSMSLLFPDQDGNQNQHLLLFPKTPVSSFALSKVLRDPGCATPCPLKSPPRLP